MRVRVDEAGESVASPKSIVRSSAGTGASWPTARIVEPLTTTTPGAIIFWPSNIRAALRTMGCETLGRADAGEQQSASARCNTRMSWFVF
jgi:hypothetical protein